MSLVSLESLSTANWIWDKLPIVVGSKLTSGQIDGDGGDRVVIRLSLLQHGAYSQPLKEASSTAACFCQGRCKYRDS